MVSTSISLSYRFVVVSVPAFQYAVITVFLVYTASIPSNFVQRISRLQKHTRRGIDINALKLNNNSDW